MIPSFAAMVAASMALVPTGPSQMTTERALAIADAAWGTPCQAQIVRAPLPPPIAMDAYFPWQGCKIEVSTNMKLSWTQYCTAVVHERGHQARGDGWHSPNPASVMYYMEERTWSFCLPLRLWPKWSHEHLLTLTRE